MISNEKKNNPNFKKILPFLMETIDDLIIIASSNNSFPPVDSIDSKSAVIRIIN